MTDDRSGERHLLARSTARLRAVQALFQMESSGATLDQVGRDFESDLLSGPDQDGMASHDRKLLRLILDNLVEGQSRIDRALERSLAEGWPITRIDPTLRAIFRAAGAELAIGKTPPRVVIAEFVEIARAFFPDDKTASFANAVLDAMTREISRDSAASS